MNIRIATEADVPALASLFRETVLKLGPVYYSEDQTQAWAASPLERDRFQQFILGVTTYMAEDASGIVGFAGIGQNGHVASVYVRHDQSGQGIGSALMTHLLAHAKRDRLPRLYAEASEFSLGLFTKFGFRLYDTEVVERFGIAFERYLVEKFTD